MTIDHDVWKHARETADSALEREEQLRSHLRQSLELADVLIAELRSQRTFAVTSHVSPPSGARTEADGDAQAASEADENAQLSQRVRELSLIVKHVEARALSAEQDLSDVANVYIASSQLHVGLRTDTIVAQINELLGQLVGAECFVVYVLKSDGRTAIPVSFEGMAQSTLQPVAVGSGVVGEALLGGEIHMRLESPLPTGSLAEPLAVIPLLVSGQAVGAVSVLRLLPQKEGWSAVDHELFRLLSHHAGVALLSAHLYREKPDLLSALAGLGESLV